MPDNIGDKENLHLELIQAELRELRKAINSPTISSYSPQQSDTFNNQTNHLIHQDLNNLKNPSYSDLRSILDNIEILPSFATYCNLTKQ